MGGSPEGWLLTTTLPTGMAVSFFFFFKPWPLKENTTRKRCSAAAGEEKNWGGGAPTQ